MSKNKHTREPLFHITKRDDMAAWKAVSLQLLGVLSAFILCGVLLMIFTGLNPAEVYVKMFEGSYGGKVTRMQSFHHAAILLCISIAVTPAFKMRFWNIGAEGQVLMGCLATAGCMLNLAGKVSEPVLMVLMVITGIIAGMFWAMIPALCKAWLNTNETLFTLMMNYVAMAIVGYFIAVNDRSGRSDLGMINDRTQIGYLPDLFGQKYILNILVVIAVVIAVAVYLRYSKQGYEISVVGESENTARYVGINVKKVIVRTMLLSGAICGLVGFMIVAGDQHSLKDNIVGGMGFTAIMVSWMSKFNPVIMVVVSVLLIFLGDGGKSATSALNVNNSIGDVLTAIVIFFIIGFEFFTRYKVNFRKKGGDR